MSNKVLVIDTSVLCCWLQVPGKDTCGPNDDQWNKARVDAVLNANAGATIVLPLATIIETGNHIAQAQGDRHSVALEFCEMLKQSAKGTIPWAAFSEQADLWRAENLIALSSKWPALAAARHSMGDATITDVAEYYSKASLKVEIITGDAGLKAYEPAVPPVQPRRRQKG